jgi:hypothetical protein
MLARASMPGVGPSYVVSINFDHVSMGGSEPKLAFYLLNERPTSNRNRFRPAYLVSTILTRRLLPRLTPHHSLFTPFFLRLPVAYCLLPFS